MGKRDEVPAQAEPKHGPHRGPSPPARGKGTKSHEYDISVFYSHFSSKKLLDFITIKSNNQSYYQNMDSIRRLIARNYKSYIIVGSPKGGRHWHILGERTGPRTIRVRRGTHMKAETVGFQSYSKANRRPREDPCDPDASLLSQLLYVKPQTKPVVTSKTVSRPFQLSSLLCYLFLNLLENETADKYENLAVRLK